MSRGFKAGAVPEVAGAKLDRRRDGFTFCIWFD